MRTKRKIKVEQDVLVCDRCLKTVATHTVAVRFTDIESGEEDVLTKAEDVVCLACKILIIKSLHMRKRRTKSEKDADAKPTPTPPVTTQAETGLIPVSADAGS